MIYVHVVCVSDEPRELSQLSFLQDLQVKSSPPAHPTPQVNNDPAIIQVGMKFFLNKKSQIKLISC